jgi:hypothetical protein
MMYLSNYIKGEKLIVIIGKIKKSAPPALNSIFNKQRNNKFFRPVNPININLKNIDRSFSVSFYCNCIKITIWNHTRKKNNRYATFTCQQQVHFFLVNECRIDMITHTHRYICFCFSNMHIHRGDIHTDTHTHKRLEQWKKKRNIQLSSICFRFFD